MSKREPKLYLQDILNSISKVEKYTRGLTYVEFSKDEKTIDAVIRNFEVIGEAARYVPKEIIAQYPDVPWEKMSSMRNKVLHEYFGVDLEILWQTIQEDLPELNKQIKDLLHR